MLQRAASNAHTWWLASQIRTKQTKWLNYDLQEMEERVQAMIKLIDEDGDSFAKKAEMYYRRRPELIQFVEETFKAYKALADRYDRISCELHKANHTIATALPDQVQLMDFDDDSGGGSSPKASPPPPTTTTTTKPPNPPPELPPIKSQNIEAHSPPNRPHHRRVASQVSRDKAGQEIDKIQKEILVLQTEKEFFKSSYESGLAKYWEIEQKITQMQEVVSELQDEFSDGSGSVIDDNEARALMAATALKSCEDTLIGMQEQQRNSMEEVRLESQRIKHVESSLKALKGETSSDHDKDFTEEEDEEVGSLKHERLELRSVCEKVKEHFQMCSDSTVVELAEKIDELVDKVISLEVNMSSRAAQIRRLRSETDELQAQLRALEEEKKSLIGDSNTLTDKLKQAEEELQRIQGLERSFKDEKRALRTRFAEACHTLNDLSETLQSPREKEKENEALEKKPEEPNSQADVVVVKAEDDKAIIDDEGSDSAAAPDWQQLLINGTEDREKILLYEYSSILRNYKETKKRLSEMEKKNQECHSETMEQIQELRSANAVKDEEIMNLRKKLFSSSSSSQITPTKIKPKPPQMLVDLFVSDSIFGWQAKLWQDQHNAASAVEDKFRAEIDTLLEENLDFWLRFSTSYHQIQKFQTTVKDLQDDQKLRELNTELQVWLEQNSILKGELQCRFASLCSIQEEIVRVAKSNEGDEAQFTLYQAAKFQGEVLNMQQENNKVAKELQSGLDHVRGLQLEVGKAMSRLHEKFEPSGSSSRRDGHHHGFNHHFRNLSSKSRIPLQKFLFGSKPKKPSLFSCMNPALQKQYSDLRARGFPT